MRNKTLKNSLVYLLCVAILMFTLMPISVSAEVPITGSQFVTASDSAYEWLKYQQDSAKLETTGLPTGLVDSFEDFSGPNQPLTEAFTYDQAVAAIAFMVKGDIDRAKKVLSTMQEMQATDGSWVNSYWYNNLYGGELRKHVGPVMWMALAVQNYEKITGDTATYRNMAIKAIDWCLKYQKENGAIAGGQTMWDVPNTWTEEVWSSTEQNQDAYAALKYFASVEPQKANEYNTAADKVKGFLDNVVWDSEKNRFYGGFKNNTGLLDPFVPLDVNPWGVMALGLTGTHNYAASLDYVENAAGDANGQGTLENPKYKYTLTDESTGNNITAYDFDWESNHSPGDPKWGGGFHDADIWFEGSAFMACAYYMAGNTSKADFILNEIIKKQATNDPYCNGGLPYSLYGTQNNYWKMLQQNCVSSTGWFIIAAAQWNPFTGSSLIQEDPTAVSKPQFSVAGGTYYSAQQVAISCATAGATIRYTTDGSEPSETSAIYSQPLTISSTTTLKACAYKDGLTSSAITVATYTLADPVSVTGVTLNKSTASLEVGESETLAATVAPANATNKAVIWTSGDNTVATVDSTGKVTGVKAGTATITVTTVDGNHIASCEAAVTEPVNIIGDFSARFNLNGTTLTVTLIPNVSSATVANLWYTDIENPTALSQARGGYNPGDKNAEGNYIVTIPNAAIGPGGLINLYLATNTGDKGWVAFNINTSTPTNVAVTAVSLNKTVTSLEVGESETLTATVAPDNATNKNITWASSDITVATVDSTGKVTGVKAGTATITVTTEDGSKIAACGVTVTSAEPVNIIGDFSARFNLNGTTLTVTLIPNVSSATVANLWYTDIENPTTLSQARGGYNPGDKNAEGNYIVTIPNAAIGPGGLINLYLATNTGDKGWVAFNINTSTPTNVAVTAVSLNKTVTSLEVGESETLTATVAPDNATNKNITWASSDITVATVDSTGRVTGAKAGTATITVTTEDGSKKASCLVTVAASTVAVTAVSLNKTATSIAVGANETLTATVTPDNATNKNVTWTSSDITVATVDSTGKVTGIKAGTATITVTTEDGSKIATCGVMVTEATNVDGVVRVGNGGYTLVPNGEQEYSEGDTHARSQELQWLPVGEKKKATENLTGPVPTNDWATSLIWGTMWTGYNQKFSEALYAIPVIFKPHAGGVKIETPPTQVINGGNDIQKHYEDAFVDINIGGTNFTAVDARADKVTDWQYDFVLNNSDKSQSIKATIMHGNPFGYFYFNNMTPKIDFTRGLPVKIISGDANSNTLLVKAMDNAGGGKFNFYGIYAPEGTTWTISGTADNVTGLTANMPNGKNYISVAALPYSIALSQTEDASTINSIFTTYKKYAYNYVTDTKVSYSYDEAAREVSTIFQFTTDNKAESTATGTITALFPHQYRDDSSNNYIGYSYNDTIRGDLKVVAGTSFTTKEKYTGVLPTMPSWNYSDSEKAQMKTYLDELINTDTYLNKTDPSKGLSVVKDTYYTGKELNKLSNALTVAEQIGDTEAADILYKTIKGELENWFTPTDSNGNLKNDKFFYYNQEVGAVIGYPSSFGSDTQLNDHHFHYGYFINAAAQVAMRDSTWASKWGGMVQLLIDDIACTDRDSTMFPYLRAMDVYEGHSWASGHAQFGDGNNQESSSEAINAWTGIILWGEASKSQSVRDLGIYLYSTEKSAIHEYWYDQYKDIFDSNFSHEAIGMVWGGKYSFGTWWTANPVETYGINFLPLAGGAFYLAEFKDKIPKVYNAAYVEGEAKNYADKGAAGATYWQDIMVKYLALADPATALAKWKTDVTPEEGESKAFTYYWLNGLNNNGTLDTSTYAINSALSVVLKKNGIKTYIAYNPTGQTKEIQFNNGAKIQVAANSLYVGAAEGEPAEQTVKPPVFGVEAGEYTSAQQVTISCETPGATIRYTVDGSEPTETSTKYTGQIAVTTSRTIKARAYKDGMIESAVISAQYTINAPEAENIIGNFNAKFSLSGTTLTITMVPKVASAVISTLWYTDAVNPTALSQARAGYNAGDKNAEGNQVIVIPNAFIGTGGLISLYIATNSGENGWVSFNINGNTAPVNMIATPTYNVAAGTYATQQQIEISCSTPGVTIRYTTDGTEPTEISQVYAAPIVVSTNTTIKACAFKDGMTKSSVASAAYTINIPAGIAVTAVSLNKTTASIAVGANETLTATVEPAAATNKNVSWTSSDSTVATVDAAGKVTGVKEGTATITVTTADGGKTAVCVVTVTGGFSVNTVFKVGSKNNATELAANNILSVTAEVTNNKQTEQQAILIVALYDENDSMINFSYLSENVLSGATERFNAGFMLPASVIGLKVKAFVWDGTDIETSSMTPLSNVNQIPN